MTPRERVLKALNFEPVDRVPYDLMEGIIWPELGAYLNEELGLTSNEEAFGYLGTDLRWCQINYAGPQQLPEDYIKAGYVGTYSDAVYERPLARATTVAEVEAHPWPKVEWWDYPDFKALHEKYPDHARAYLAGWQPLFCGACNAFGMENALMHMCAEPELFEAFVKGQHERYMKLLKKAVDLGVAEYCDIVWLGDDYASADALMMNPALWRQLIKPYLAEQVRYLRDQGLYVIFHCCGNAREILPDFIDIGINAHVVFQTRAKTMDAESIARDFGGKLAFYGGIDVQQLLTFGTPDQVKAEVEKNVGLFRDCGGYIVANSHHCIANIQGRNVVAMCEAARNCVID